MQISTNIFPYMFILVDVRAYGSNSNIFNDEPWHFGLP